MTESSTNSLMKWFIQTGLLAIAYCVAGRLALLLAIPPGYATAIWPAAGIALAALLLWGNRLWPGVVFGSFLVNIWTSFDASTTATMISSMSVALAIGSGAALQALVGAILIRRFVGFPDPLVTERSIIRFLILGGPASCIVSPFVGVTTLLIAGINPASNYIFSVFTWWVGDTIGVLIVAPLVVMWLVSHKTLYHQRRVTVTVPLMLTFLLAVVVFVYSSRWEVKNNRDEFNREAHLISNALVQRFDQIESLLHYIDSYFAGSQAVTREEFHVYVKNTFERLPGIQAVEWINRISQYDRKEFEEAIQSEGFFEFTIREANDQGDLVAAGNRPEYFPVTYIEPIKGNEAALGFDLASDQSRMNAMAEARDSGKPFATSRLQLIQNIDAAYGSLIVHPIYLKDQPTNTIKDRRENLIGFALAAFRIDDLIQAALTPYSTNNLELHIHDLAGRPGERVMYCSLGDRCRHSGEINADSDAMQYSWKRSVTVAGRAWSIQLLPSLEYLASRRTWHAWLVLTGGLLFTSLLGAFLFILTGRSARIQELVDERTTELSQANHQLEREVVERRRAETEITSYAKQLEQRNEELSNFSWISSHDLQEPLRKLISFSELLRSDMGGTLSEAAERDLNHIVDAARRMKNLVDSLREFSWTGLTDLSVERTDVNEVVDHVTNQLSQKISDAGAHITHDTLPVVHSDRAFITNIYKQLIDNALLFQSEEAPNIHLTSLRDGEMWHLGVKDNGIGIKQEYTQQIFAPFKRLHRQTTHSGTGIGLAICQKAVERLGGRIWVESDPGKGSTFHFTIPCSESDTDSHTHLESRKAA